MSSDRIAGVHRRRLVTGLTVAFAIMTAAFVTVGAIANPIGFVLAALFALVTWLLWYQASGRLASRVYRRVEQQAATSGGGGRRSRQGRRGADQQRGGFGAGPKEDWTGPRRGQRGQPDSGPGPGSGSGPRRGPGPGSGPGGRQRQRRRRRPTPSNRAGMSAHQAAQILGVEPGADEDDVRSAYRDRIKEVHPDTDGGDEDAFRRVQAAYERLSD